MRVLIFIVGLGLMFASSASAADDAESTYKERCLSCHGANGDGNGHAQMKIKPQDLRSEAVQKKSDEELYNAIAFGVGHVEYAHAFSQRGLSSAQISQLVTYIRSFAKNSKKNR
ncbi:MAG TPA: cytochrome c [Candidatus Limnocylindrales bacterium]|nr:cytochrome c [Candidatus Limnocylindrales bacterium]